MSASTTANAPIRDEQDAPPFIGSIAGIKAAAGSLDKDDTPGFERLIKEAIAAKSSEIQAEQIKKLLAKRLGVSKSIVEKRWREIFTNGARAEVAPSPETEARRAEVAEVARSKLFEQCGYIAESPTLLEDMVRVVHRMGVISERRGILAAYLTAASRLHAKGAISLLRRGAAASGKNFLADAVFRLIPAESVITAISGSPKSLVYYGGAEGEDALKHKIVYVPEAAAIADRGGVESEFTTMLRVLISENRIVHQVVQTQDNKPPITVTVTKNGPISVLITSARDNIEDEMMTRLLITEADESRGQTQAIVKNALTDHNRAVPPKDVEDWVAYQRWLELGGPYDVNVPYLEAIAQVYGDPSKAAPLRIRRDIEGFKRAIMASAILHAAQRERRDGRIVASMADYEWAHEAFDYDMSGLYARTVPPTAQAVVVAIEALIKDEQDKAPGTTDAKVTYKTLRSALGISSNDTAGQRLSDAVERGLIERTNPDAGRSAGSRYRVLIPSAELEGRKLAGVFPFPEDVQKAFAGAVGKDTQHEGGGDSGLSGLSGANGARTPRNDGKGPSHTAYTGYTANSEGETPTRVSPVSAASAKGRL